MESAWDIGLYGKFALMQEEVRNVSFAPLAERGEGAVVKEPDRLLESEYV